ncbi:hypothetical protein G6F65_019010 [Rhizopus arrhizus]|nr:hypothetical protein G6F65_019010 [Rhizopus arrhizus]
MLGNASARRAAARLGHGLAALLPEALRPGVPSGGADLCRRAPDELRLQQDAVLADAAAGAAAVADRPGAGLDARAARHRRGHPAACDFQRRPHFDDLGRDALGALRRQTLTINTVLTQDSHGSAMRHRRPAQRWQIDTLQCSDPRRHRRRELSVLHHRTQRRCGRGAGSASAEAG